MVELLALIGAAFLIRWLWRAKKEHDRQKEVEKSLKVGAGIFYDD